MIRLLIPAVAFVSLSANAWCDKDLFRDEVAPLLARRCLSCHNETKAEGGLSMTQPISLIDGEYIDRSNVKASHLLSVITPQNGSAEMPKDSDPLRPDEIATIANWIGSGAKIPPEFTLSLPELADHQWWSLQPLASNQRDLSPEQIDRLIEHRLNESGLQPLAIADPRTLIRRITYDLTGLPPTPPDIDKFVAAYRSAPEAAWSRLVDRLLRSPEFGEKWGRHWLDVARYAETHGYDKDQPRNYAWPYRDYVIRSFNRDKPVGQFVQEQIAGDVLAEDRSEGIVATGFLVAGPWDLIAHQEVGEGKLDGRIAKHLDRDEMASAVFNAFQSTTIQCAQCHDHKFDPIASMDYYRVHAVFAGIDRADRVYTGVTEEQRTRKQTLENKRADLFRLRDDLKNEQDEKIAERTGAFASRLKELTEKASRNPPPSQHGFHSTIASQQTLEKWVQVDLGKPTDLGSVELVACYDDFNRIGAGFGFPIRFRVEVAGGGAFDAEQARTILDASKSDFPNPGMMPVSIDCDERGVRFIRVTATKLAERRKDYILSLGELRAIGSGGEENVALSGSVSASDQIPPNARWAPRYLVDDRYHRWSLDRSERDEYETLRKQQAAAVASVTTPQIRRRLSEYDEKIRALDQQIAAIPDGEFVYAASTDFKPKGQFRPTKGTVRPIHFLNRGDLTSPGKRVFPGAPPLWPNAPNLFVSDHEYDESESRASLARFVTDRDNPLLWRSMANRVWQWVFGKALVATPNDFGRMGAEPTHPEILDRLAAQLRDDPEQSIKRLVRLLVLTQAYQRATTAKTKTARKNSDIDAANDGLWRFNRRRLTAEEFRDSLLSISGVLRLDQRGGPSFKDFVVEHPQHSPHYEYHLHDPSDPKSHRRTVYRFVVRSQPQPMLATLDCADPSISVPKRDESTTALQALAQWNNRLVESMAIRFAERLDREADNGSAALDLACRLAWGRAPDPMEREVLLELTRRHGNETLCRVVINASATMYID